MTTKNKNIAIFSLIILAIASIMFVACKDEEQEENKNSLPTVNLKSYMSSEFMNGKKLFMAIDHITRLGDTLSLHLDNGKLVKEPVTMFEREYDVPDYWDTDREKFYKWVDEKLKEGYFVIVSYDEKTQMYCGWTWQDK